MCVSQQWYAILQVSIKIQSVMCFCYNDKILNEGKIIITKKKFSKKKANNLLKLM